MIAKHKVKWHFICSSAGARQKYPKRLADNLFVMVTERKVRYYFILSSAAAPTLSPALVASGRVCLLQYRQYKA